MSTTARIPARPPIIDPDPGERIKRQPRTSHDQAAPTEPGRKQSLDHVMDAARAAQAATGIANAVRGAKLAALVAAVRESVDHQRPPHTSWLPER